MISIQILYTLVQLGKMQPHIVRLLGRRFRFQFYLDVTLIYLRQLNDLEDLLPLFVVVNKTIDSNTFLCCDIYFDVPGMFKVDTFLRRFSTLLLTRNTEPSLEHSLLETMLGRKEGLELVVRGKLRLVTASKFFTPY